MSAINDPNAVRRQFATDAGLRIRKETHDKYTVPRINFVDWALNCLQWYGSERVLDVGCGTGIYYPPLVERSDAPDKPIQYYGLDFSAGMLDRHMAGDEGYLAIADVQEIPYADSSFDVVMANHMLYHVSDIERAIQEFKRVLKPDGVIMATTNSLQTMPELQVLMRRAIILLSRSGGGSQIQAPMAASDLFALENGARQLSRHFYAVMRHDLPGALMFSEIEPLMAYIESTREMREPQLPADVAWEDVMVIMRQQVTHLINHLGELPINKLTGVLIASDSGDFIRQFVEYRAQTEMSE